MKLHRYLPYKIPKKCLFSMAPEQSHYWSLKALDTAYRLGVTGRSEPLPGRRFSLAGLQFENGIGLAAGLDKDGTHINSLGSLGFGSIEVGTVTPKPQPGNPSPRVFRLANKEAIINRMGFNNQGVEAMLPYLKSRSYTGILGVNVGKNKNTPMDKALDDYVYCMKKTFPFADYITANISSPNTQGLRDLQSETAFQGFLQGLVKAHEQLQRTYGQSKPLFIKLAPDLEVSAIECMAKALLSVDIGGVILTNTTLSRVGVQDHLYGHEQGGLSGAPLLTQSNQVLADFRTALGPSFPLIGVGGILSACDVAEKRKQGADAVQIYTGFIYKGWALIEQSVLF